MHGGMLERDRSVGWRTGSTRVPLLEQTTVGGQGSLRRHGIQVSRCGGTFRRSGALFAAMHGQFASKCRKSHDYAVLAILMLVASGCAAVPDADDDIAEATATSSTGPIILGPDGVLDLAQSSRLLSSVAGDAEPDGLLERHLRVEQAVAGTPLTVGNATELLRDGEGAFAAIFAAIEEARHHVNLEYYTLEDVEFDGRRLSDLLIAKRQQGVAVNIIYDSFGSISTPDAFFKRLENAGASLVEFRPVNPLEAAASGYSPNDRNHRKIVIVDGKTAVVGGVNLATYYQSRTLGSDEPEEEGRASDQRPETWRDLSIRIEGPAVGQLQGLFLGHWNSEDGPEIDQSSFFPKHSAEGGEIVRIIGSSPQQDTSRYYITLISAIRHAERRIWLTTGYFVPTFEEKRELMRAAERGVDVQLLLPAVSDASQAVAVARSHYSDLLEAGVRIFEIDHVILHSKAVTIDGVWSAVGSSNLDHRSVLFNDEVDVIVLGRRAAERLELIFEEDRATAKEIKLEDWKKRPLTDRLTDFLQRTLQYVL
jgi:cardiolipin synthase